MKFEHVSGCICDSLNVDGKETIEMSNDEIKSYIAKLLDKVDDIAVLQSILIDIIDSIGDYECANEPCECCGDYVTTYTVDLIDK